ncbi:NAD(P)H-dependent oxidoreductase [Myceligenerans pegani]|uniref:NAD(P)H-dependent oxidoreductase n=1 Tax=Myceligenerans pegani TaxID=2776917 RepID=A0ABR9N6X5_9MICO|nr:NAD(P)H-dependent oxidoreductase [Myceligenerans sp. TRM 65318]MBE1878797.1 NAD(P)H-dependent oxidoreductase [Myceligenerans sp. TRM 65318]MBE3021068.1 NAD(P)H-dependent oxidoreductase [Myceligenerans sp. TRM 65318]
MTTRTDTLADVPEALARPADTSPRTLRVAVVNGSPSERSKTMGLVDVVLRTLRTALTREGIEVEENRVDVYRLGPEFTGALEREGVAPGVEHALRVVEQSDVLIAATPVFRGSYTGMFKHFFDLIDQYALANKPVFLAATGGGDHHALVLEHALRPLFGFFQAMTFPVAVFASSGDFDGTTLLNPRVHGRIEMAVTDVTDLLVTRATSRPQPPR